MSEKSGKTKISRSIIQAIHAQSPPGRFLERDPNLHTWAEVCEKRALEKTSQALRDHKLKSSNTFEKSISNRHEESDTSLPEDIPSFWSTIETSHGKKIPSAHINTTIHSSFPIEKKENVCYKYPNISESKKLNICCHVVPKLNKQNTNNFECATSKCSKYLKKDQSEFTDNELSIECYEFLGIPYHNYEENKNEKVDQDEINSLIYQTFFGMKEQV